MSKEIITNNSLLEFIVLANIKMVRPLNESLKPMLSPLQTNVVLLLKIYGPMRMTQLTDKLMMPKQQMTQIAHHLEDIGFISRRVDQNDRRRIIVELTDKANEYADEKINSYLKKFFFESSELSPKEKRLLTNSISIINSILHKVPVK
ncbi:MAG: MarR family winged helix-turn-helix transcriptional regulator [Christensenellales bacterium]|jgi:DNA-binding MarR family transcriptional regulator